MSRARVLVVDDKENYTKLFRRILPEDRFDVTTAEDGERAIGLTTAAPFDVIVTDIRMPGADGRAVLQAARAVGRRAIVSRGWADLSAEDAPDCLTIGEANLKTLFTRVAAVVHHGGAGTSQLAALGGAPQVIVPQMYDQHYWARRIEALGAGVAHAPGTPSAASLTQALESALLPAVRTSARTLVASIRPDGARVAALQLAAGHA